MHLFLDATTAADGRLETSTDFSATRIWPTASPWVPTDFAQLYYFQDHAQSMPCLDKLGQTLFLAITGVGARRGVNSQGALNAFGRSSPLCGTQHKAELFEQTIQQVPTFSGRPNGALAQRLISHQPPACRSPSRNPPIQATGARQFCVCSAIRHSEQTHIPSGSRTWRSPCSHPRQPRPQSSARS
jgi:hypothetical protein